MKGLRELVDLYRERLTDADWGYQELLEQLKTMTNTLPAAQGAEYRAKRWWWPFRQPPATKAKTQSESLYRGRN